MSYLSLDKRVALADTTKPDVLLACEDSSCAAINAVIKSLREQATDLRRQANDLADKAGILADEVRRRAELLDA